METEKKETVYARGIYFDKPKEGRPDFVKGELAVKVDDAVAFLQEHKNSTGYCRFDLLKKKDGTGYYFTLNQWEPKTEEKKGFDGAGLINEPHDEVPF